MSACLSLVQIVNHLRITFFQRCPLDLFGGGYITVLFIKLSGQQGEFFDGFDLGQVFIHFNYFLVNQFLYLIILGQVGKGGIRNAVVLGIFGHIIFVDQYQGCQKFAAIADNDGILDISTELQLILNEGRVMFFPPAVMMISFLRSIILR